MSSDLAYLNYLDQYVNRTPLEERIKRFQELINDHDVYFRLMNWNLDVMMHFIHKSKIEHKPYKPPSHSDAVWAVPGCFY